MAKPITNISSGIYSRVIDLTTVSRSVGTFAGASLGLTEKGPAFEVVTVANMDERILKLGNLNPNFPSSYFAESFLGQANNYKEVRLLGLEGYSDTIAYAIAYNIPSTPPTAAIPGGSPTFIPKVGNTYSALNVQDVQFTSEVDGGGHNGIRVKVTSSVLLNNGDAVTINIPGSGLAGLTGTYFIKVDKNSNWITLYTDYALSVPVGLASFSYTAGTGTLTKINTIDVITNNNTSENLTLTVYSGTLAITPGTAVSFNLTSKGLTLAPTTGSGFYYVKTAVPLGNGYQTVITLTTTSGGTTDVTSTGSFTGNAQITFGTYTTATYGTPFTATMESIAAILKPRKTTFTGLPEVSKVEIATPVGMSNPEDNNFIVRITYADTTSQDVVCSLRPADPDYIAKTFGTLPLDNTVLFGQRSPLWVDFVIPSATRRLTLSGVNTTPAYYYPGESDPANSKTSLDMLVGNITINTEFQYAPKTVSGATNASPIVLTVTGHGYGATSTIKRVVVKNIVGNTNANGTFYAKVVDANSLSLWTDAAATSNPVAGNASYTSGGTVQLHWVPTWETEVLNFVNTIYQTPVTPWFVGAPNSNGTTQKLFRIWSISDGRSANVETKVELSNFDQTTNGGNGSFDLFVRDFNDREDLTRTVLEGYTHISMDPTSDNYIAKKIGDGENFAINSQFIFVEMNETEELPISALPYGVEGYPNTTGLVFPNVIWTKEYDKSKPVGKQILGLASNSINMFSSLKADQLVYLNNSGLCIGKGFHLNPNNSSKIDTSEFTVADQGIYTDTNNIPLSVSEKAKRMKYVVAVAGGFDGWNVYAERNWNNTSSPDYASLQLGLTKFADPEDLLSDFSVLVTPDIDLDDHPSAIEVVLATVEGRADALYLSDFAYDAAALPQQASDTLKFSNVKSSFNAMYFPWIQRADSLNKKNIWVPPSTVALATIASVATNENVFQPPAGSLRTITTNIIRTRRRMALGDREILKAQNINPITQFPGTGFEITETRTTQDVFSALSFIHNRLLLGYAKKAINQTLRPLLHQLNGTIIQTAFVNVLTPIFDRIKKLNGLEDFKVEVDTTNADLTTLYGKVIIVPLYPVERIVVDFVLTNNGVSFNNL
jgi:hypothetical protein